jgi:hypothetical protein
MACQPKLTSEDSVREGFGFEAREWPAVAPGFRRAMVGNLRENSERRLAGWTGLEPAASGVTGANADCDSRHDLRICSVSCEISVRGRRRTTRSDTVLRGEVAHLPAQCAIRLSRCDQGRRGRTCRKAATERESARGSGHGIVGESGGVTPKCAKGQSCPSHLESPTWLNAAGSSALLARLPPLGVAIRNRRDDGTQQLIYRLG